MNVVATILNGELLRPREKLSSDSFSSNGLSDPKRANEESIPKCVAQKACNGRFRLAGSENVAANLDFNVVHWRI